MQMNTSLDLLVHTNMFLKIQNIHTLAPLYINSEHCDSLTVRFLSIFCVLFFQDQHFVSGFVPRLLLRGIRFLVEEAAEMCVTEYGALYACVALILPIPEGGEEACSCQRQCRNGKVCQAVVPLSPAHTNTRVTRVMDTKMSSITLPASEVKDADYERPCVPHQNKLLGLRGPAFNRTDRYE